MKIIHSKEFETGVTSILSGGQGSVNGYHKQYLHTAFQRSGRAQ